MHSILARRWSPRPHWSPLGRAELSALHQCRRRQQNGCHSTADGQNGEEGIDALAKMLSAEAAKLRQSMDDQAIERITSGQEATTAPSPPRYKVRAHAANSQLEAPLGTAVA